MTALEYFRTKQRMTNSCTLSCFECNLSFNKNGLKKNCDELEWQHPEQAIAIVEAWAKANPLTTYRTKLLEHFPQADITQICRCEIYGGDCGLADEDCGMCWDMEVRND
jgi:hypothetical protein